jgi:hypothetical protein
MPERNFLVSLPEAEWEQTHEAPLSECLASDLQCALKLLRVQQKQEEREEEGE